MKIALETSTLW